MKTEPDSNNPFSAKFVHFECYDCGEGGGLQLDESTTAEEALRQCQECHDADDKVCDGRVVIIE